MIQIKRIFCALVLSLLFYACRNDNAGKTEITKWQYNKRSAVSITWDDGNINQFKHAMPVMDRLKLPGTFFIVTGELPGSQFKAKFIGRPVKQIIEETKTITTNKNNFFERASAIGYLGFKGTLDFHFKAGSLYEAGKVDDAYKIIDDAYAKVRVGKFMKGKDISWEASQSSANTWDDFNRYATKGHEFGSHTISHARLAVLDEANLLYELEKSKEDLLNHMGAKSIFSGECPFGTEDERVMQYAHKVYPALRNRMPHPFLEELARWNTNNPASSDKEYVQWQRGGLTNISVDSMKSWVDTITSRDNIWLVLVFHGVDGIGWEPRTTADLQAYFEYIKEKDDKIWVATFGDVTKYIRERMSAKISSAKTADKILINLTHGLDRKIYNGKLTLKTYLPDAWKTAQVKQDGLTEIVKTNKNDKGIFIIYQANPNAGPIEISQVGS